eukprot:CCRYP_003496-RA/>CCRYP_003496-RA protein AED:0.46 eAED:0.48 QI:0/0/0/0.75/0/0.25/4/0/228
MDDELCFEKYEKAQSKACEEGSQVRYFVGLLPKSNIGSVENVECGIVNMWRLAYGGQPIAVEGDFDPDAINGSLNEVQSGSIRAKLRPQQIYPPSHHLWNDLASNAGTIRALVDAPDAIEKAQWGVIFPRTVIAECFHCGIVGINQIFDRDIDVLNRPFLPVASGEMSGRVAWAISYSLSPLEFFNAFLTGVLSKAGAFQSIPVIGGHAVLAGARETSLYKEILPTHL